MSAILLESQIVHYEVLGRGRPLIFLHGWVGSWRYWIPAMQAASVAYRTYAIDLWGFGDTAKDPAQYTLDRQVMLVEKNESNESSAWRMDSVTDIRSDDNFYAKYMAGAYGAVPQL